jgi:ADP-ribose pyrophosphatase YjhB (NUDIX family)
LVWDDPQMKPATRYLYCPYDGERLGFDEGRPKCERCGFIDYQNPKPAVAILITRGSQLLLALRGIEPAKGMWDIPGGFIETGESAEEAVVRETLEETALHVRVVDFLGSVPDVYGDRNEPTLNLCFMAKVLGGDLRAQSDVESLAWFTPDHLPERMAFSHQFQMLQRYRERISQPGPGEGRSER